MSEYRAFLAISVYITASESGLRAVLYREIDPPPAWVGWQLGIQVDDSFPYKIEHTIWVEPKRALVFYADLEINYRDQGQPELEIPERRKVFFNAWVQAMLDGGWKRGEPTMLLSDGMEI